MKSPRSEALREKDHKEMPHKVFKKTPEMKSKRRNIMREMLKK